MIQVFESSGRGAHFYPDYPPFLKLEPSSKCTRKCEFCSIVDNVHGHFMDYALFERILEESSHYDIKKVSFSIHGEPTLHPRIVDMIRDTRATFPDARIFTITNGDVFRARDGMIEEMYEAGIDDIQLDAYDWASSAYVDDLLSNNAYIRENVSIVNAFEDQENVWSLKKTNKHLIVVRENANFEKGHEGIRNFDTQGSGTPFEMWEKYGLDISRFPIRKSCKEGHKYMTITVDGIVPLCCASNIGAYDWGDITKQSIRDIWRGQIAESSRFALSMGRRDLFPQCYACNKRSFRDGLWPYWGEKGSYNEADLRFEIALRTNTYEKLKDNLKKLDARHPIANPDIRAMLYDDSFETLYNGDFKTPIDGESNE